MNELKTERLLLRRWKETDAEDLYEYAKDPAVGPIAGWPPHKSVENSLEVIRNVFLSAPEAYAICRISDDKAIGAIELKLYGRSDLLQNENECELGYWLGKPFWGHGIMTEAAAAMLKHAFTDLNMETVWCAYYDGNERSKRVQEKCGFIYQWTNDSVDVPLMHEKRKGHVNRLTREEWLKLEDKDRIRKTDACFDKPYWVIDLLPFQVPKEGGERFSAIEKHYLEKDELRRKFVDVLLKLNCYHDFLLFRADADEGVRNPAPELLEQELLRNKGTVNILLDSGYVLISVPDDSTCMTVYDPDDDLLKMIRLLAEADGLFIWRPLQDGEE